VGLLAAPEVDVEIGASGAALNVTIVMLLSPPV
jgi:hypothetical protein